MACARTRSHPLRSERRRTCKRWVTRCSTSRDSRSPTPSSSCARSKPAPSPARSCRSVDRHLSLAMSLAAKRRSQARSVLLDRSLEELPLFRLSDAPDDAAISYTTEDGGRWRVLASPGDRLPGTFDQDVYVELMHRFQEAGEPADGALTFTLHAFLRSMGRQADGRTYEQLRGSLTRLERTVLQSEQSYFDSTSSSLTD